MPAKQPNPRSRAAKILQRVIYKGESLSTALQDNDDPMVSDLCYGCLRWHEPLSALLHELLSKNLKNKDKDIECLLRVGLYQIIYQNTPDHAAVGETVNALKGLKKPWAKKLVNAVLRNYLRGQEKLQTIISHQETARYAFPQWLIDAIKTAWPDHWEAILDASNQRAPMTLRVNQRVQTRATYLEKLASNGIQATPHPSVETAIQLAQPCPVSSLPDFAAGAASVQDAAAQNAAILLDCQPGMTVLDACAAPGGKTGHILESTPDLEVTAVDNSERRLERVIQNLERLRLQAKIVTSDILAVDNYAQEKQFDRILLDAPCSATGVIRRHPDIKVLRRPSDIDALVSLQGQMLNTLWDTLKPGGILLYATCSILPQENEMQIKTFLASHSDASVLPIAKGQGLGRQVVTGEESMDGFYYAKLLKD